MEIRGRRAVGASIATVALLAAVPAAHASVGVSQISSLPAKALAGNLSGLVTNDGDSAKTTTVTVRAMRYQTGGALVGQDDRHRARARLDVLPGGREGPVQAQEGHVLPRGLRAQGRRRRRHARLRDRAQRGPGQGRRPADRHPRQRRVRPAQPLRRQGRRTSPRRSARPGPRWLSPPGNRVWPDLGNSGYKSVHTDVFIVYDAPTDKFLPGNARRPDAPVDAVPDELRAATSTRHNSAPPRPADRRRGPNLTIQSITIDGVPATWEQKQPTYAGDPERRRRSRSARARRVEHEPGRARRTRTRRPARRPTTRAATQGVQCGKTKLVITPGPADPGRHDLQGRRSTTSASPASARTRRSARDGWFKNNSPAGEGSMVTTEPSGTDGLDAAQQPGVGQADAGHPHDDQLRPGADGRPATASRSATAASSRPSSTRRTRTSRPARARSTGTRPSPSSPTWSRTSVGHFDESERMATAGDVLYYEFQSANIADAKKVSNQAIMDHAGSDHALPGEPGQRSVPVQRERHHRRVAERLLRGGDADEDRLRRWLDRRADLLAREHAPVVGRRGLLLAAALHVLQGGLRGLPSGSTWPTSRAWPPAPVARPPTRRRSRPRS